MIILPLAVAVAALAGPGDRQAAAASQPAPRAAKAPRVDRAAAGRAAPAATLVLRDGTPRRIADFRGRPVLVNLWATWCAPCKAEMPALDRLAARSRGKLAVVAVSQDLEGWRAVDRFFAPGRFASIVSLLDRTQALPIAYRAEGLPASILYDARGREVWRVLGPIEWDRIDPAALARL